MKRITKTVKIEKIRYKNLGPWLKMAVIAGVAGFIYYATLAIAFIIGVMIGLLMI